MDKNLDAETGRELLPAPTEPGWYTYKEGSSGVNPGEMIFHLRITEGKPQWSAHFDNGDSGDCAWSYIEQGLGVFNLVKLGPVSE